MTDTHSHSLSVIGSNADMPQADTPAADNAQLVQLAVTKPKSIAPPPPGQKKRVYFNEYNVLMGDIAYLPLVSGLLQANAIRSKLVREHYQFMPYLFVRGPVAPLLEQHDRPDIAAFSLAMWNEQLCLKLAQAVKEKYPNCIIIFGGAHVPHHAQQYLKQNTFIDIAVRAAGEQAFAEILERLTHSQNLSGIAGLTWRNAQDQIMFNDQDPQLPEDLDDYPSPYLEGLYEYLFDAQGNPIGKMKYQTIIETNRGCPFPCTYCYWGQGGLSRKFRFHSIGRVQDEIKWFAQHRIPYVFNADSNFGMHKQDMQVAQYLAKMKKQYNFPEKFRTCYGKNTDDRIYDIATFLHDEKLGKGITLARQTNDKQVLKNIKRANIKMSTYQNLQVRFNERNVPVYSELILGLPGETFQTWTTGIEGMLQSGLKNQLFIYQCQVYPNTDMGESDYQKKFGIQTQRIALAEIHAGLRGKELVTEYEDIIVATDAMPLQDWRAMSKFSWVLMTLHGLKLGFYLMTYLADRHHIPYTDFVTHISDGHFNHNAAPLLKQEIDHFDQHVDDMLQGKERAVYMPEFGHLYWDIEEASLLRVAGQIDLYYDQLLQLTYDFLQARQIDFDENEVAQVIHYQRMRMPSLDVTGSTSHAFDLNLPQYFEQRLGKHPVELKRQKQTLVIEPKDFRGNKQRYAKQTLLWGRKSGTMLTNAYWNPGTQTPQITICPTDQKIKAG